MFEEFANPPKGKGKEKDVGRRRAYVRVVTSVGGSLNLELFCEKVRSTIGLHSFLRYLCSGKAPKTCYNFLMLAKQGKYNDVMFHRLVPGFMVRLFLLCIRIPLMVEWPDSNWRSDGNWFRGAIILGDPVPR